MKPVRHFVVITFALFAVSCIRLAAQVPTTPTTPPIIDWPQMFPVGDFNATTSVVLRKVEGEYALPPPPVSIALLAGSTLKLSLPFADDDIAAVTWFQDDKELSEKKSVLIVARMDEKDAGTYTAYAQLVNGNLANFAGYVEKLIVRVDTPRPQRLLNLSSRTTITPSNPMLIGGFVVGANGAKAGESRTVLIRAVGPSLASLGVPNPLAMPQLKIFDHAGNEVIQPARPAVWLGYNATTVAAKVGAFPLLPDAHDVAWLLAVTQGPYTVQVISGDGTSGDVLLEVYEVPAEFLRADS